MAKKDIAPFEAPTAPAAIDRFKSAVTNYANSAPAQYGDGKPFLRLLKGDGWHWGPEDNPVEEGSHWAVNVLTAMHGYSCWTDHKNGQNEKLGEMLVPIEKPPVDPADLPDHGWEWRDTFSIELACVSGADKGVEVRYTNSSVGGLDFFRSLMRDVAQHLEEDPLTVIPIVELELDHYPHKTYGRVYKPKYAIVGWAKVGDKTIEEEPKKAAKKSAPRRRSRRAA